MSASLTDFITGLDPTAFVSITGAQLAELVGLATPYTDKGLIVLTSDSAGIPAPPDATGTPKWQTYLWLRLSPLTTSFTLYAWNPAQTFNVGYSDGSGNFVTTHWNPVTTGGIGAGSIQGYQIAAATITADKIQTISISQVTGFNPATYVQTTATPTGGVIGGTFASGLTINNASITTAMLIDLNVTTGKIADKNVTVGKILGGTINQLLTTADNANTAAWATPPLIYSTAGIPVAANANKLLAVNGGATDYTLNTFASYADPYVFAKFTSAATAITLGAALINTAHGLGAMPTFVRAVCVCQTGEQGYTAGDEVDIAAFNANSTSSLFIFGAGATNVFASSINNGATFSLVKKDGSGTAAATLANWKIKIYAHL